MIFEEVLLYHSGFAIPSSAVYGHFVKVGTFRKNICMVKMRVFIQRTPIGKTGEEKMMVGFAHPTRP
jgi:hypothetical protein